MHRFKNWRVAGWDTRQKSWDKMSKISMSILHSQYPVFAHSAIWRRCHKFMPKENSFSDLCYVYIYICVYISPGIRLYILYSDWFLEKSRKCHKFMPKENSFSDLCYANIYIYIYMHIYLLESDCIYYIPIDFWNQTEFQIKRNSMLQINKNWKRYMQSDSGWYVLTRVRNYFSGYVTIFRYLKTLRLSYKYWSPRRHSNNSRTFKKSKKM